jgi:hypothetical protein
MDISRARANPCANHAGEIQTGSRIAQRPLGPSADTSPQIKTP